MCSAIAKRPLSPSVGHVGDLGAEDEWIVVDSSTTDKIEIAWLAIEYLGENKANEMWQRPTIKRVPLNAGRSVLHFEVTSARILPPQNDNLEVKRYVVYELSVRQDSTTIDPNSATLQRRYTDFLNLYTNLKRDYAYEMSTVDFPRKTLLGNFSLDLMAERGAAFEVFLDHIVSRPALRNSPHFLDFLQNAELKKACQLLDERHYELAISLLEDCFRLLNKIFTDRSRPVILVLCRLVVACTTTPVQHSSSDGWVLMAIRRFETICDSDLLPLYIPLLHTCVQFLWQNKSAQKFIINRLQDMSRKGINVSNSMSLMAAIHLLDPQSETI